MHFAVVHASWKTKLFLTVCLARINLPKHKKGRDGNMKIRFAKIEKYMRLAFVALSLAAAVYNFIDHSWELFFTSILTIVLLMLPTMMAKRAKISIPAPFQIVILLFIFASMYLGEIHDYYYRLKWWDTLLHGSSAILLGYTGFLLIYALNKDKKMHVRLSPFFMALFSFCFALSVGALWEIFEFAVDGIFGANMQKARNLELVNGVFDTRLGVFDTMLDLIVDFVGALTVSIAGFFHAKRRQKVDSAFWRLHQQFIEENPALFEK